MLEVQTLRAWRVAWGEIICFTNFVIVPKQFTGNFALLLLGIMYDATSCDNRPAILKYRGAHVNSGGARLPTRGADSGKHAQVH